MVRSCAAEIAGCRFRVFTGDDKKSVILRQRRMGIILNRAVQRPGSRPVPDFNRRSFLIPVEIAVQQIDALMSESLNLTVIMACGVRVGKGEVLKSDVFAAAVAHPYPLPEQAAAPLRRLDMDGTAAAEIVNCQLLIQCAADGEGISIHDQPGHVVQECLEFRDRQCVVMSIPLFLLHRFLGGYSRLRGLRCP